MSERYIRHVPQRRVLGLDGVTPVGVVIHQEFLLQCTAQPVFTAGKNGIEAIEFAIEARKLIRETGEERACLQGHWPLPDDVARAIKKAVEEGSWNAAHAEALLPFMKASQDLLSEPPPPPAIPAAAGAN
jgi:hypothetical protein